MCSWVYKKWWLLHTLLYDKVTLCLLLTLVGNAISKTYHNGHIVCILLLTVAHLLMCTMCQSTITTIDLQLTTYHLDSGIFSKTLPDTGIVCVCVCVVLVQGSSSLCTYWPPTMTTLLAAPTLVHCVDAKNGPSPSKAFKH